METLAFVNKLLSVLYFLVPGFKDHMELYERVWIKPPRERRVDGINEAMMSEIETYAWTNYPVPRREWAEWFDNHSENREPGFQRKLRSKVCKQGRLATAALEHKYAVKRLQESCNDLDMRGEFLSYVDNIPHVQVALSHQEFEEAARLLVELLSAWVANQAWENLLDNVAQSEEWEFPQLHDYGYECGPLFMGQLREIIAAAIVASVHPDQAGLYPEKTIFRESILQKPGFLRFKSKK